MSILDRTNSGIDSDRNACNRTMIVTPFATGLNADEIVVIEAGVILDEGRRLESLTLDGIS